MWKKIKEKGEKGGEDKKEKKEKEKEKEKEKKEKEEKKGEKKEKKGWFGGKSEKEADNPKNTFMGNLKQMAKEERIQLMQTLPMKPDNSSCADCGDLPVVYLSTTLGCFLCEACGDIHKEFLPENISIVVSLTNEAFNERNAWINHPIAPQIIVYATFTGNSNANNYWEAKFTKPDAGPKLSNYDSRKTFITEKYQQGEFVRDAVWLCKLKKKKAKRKFLVVDDREKAVLLYPSDPRAAEADKEVPPEVTLNLQECTLQFDSELSSTSFKLISKGTEYFVDGETPKGMYDIMFAIHRTWDNVMEASAFQLGKWLDRIGFSAAMQAQDFGKVREYCQDDEKYAVMRDDRNWTPLHTACNEGQIDMAMLLLDFPVDLEFRNTSGDTPLHLLFARGEALPVPKTKEFLEKITRKFPQLNWDFPNSSGTTYLHLAVQSSSKDLSLWLLAKGANADVINNANGFSALLSAVSLDQMEIVRSMLDKGADIFQKTKQGKSALELAHDHQHKAMHDMLFDIWETRRIQNQTNVINEILTTETDYVDKLGILVTLYRRSLETDLHLSPKAIKALFSNAEDILTAASAFLKDIQPIRDLPPEKKDIGGRFVRNLAYFQMYIPYCTNQSISMKSLDICLSHPHIASFVRDLETKNKEKLRSEKIDGYLIKPLQRITRFPLLLRELQKYTPDTHVDHTDLNKACEHLAEIVGKANEAKRERDHKDEIMETFAQQGVKWSLTSRLVGEGKCAISGVDTKLDSTNWFLFSDVFILAKPSKSEVNFKIENLVILSTLPLLWEVQGKEANKLCQFAFSIVLPDRANVKITVCVTSKEERQALMDLLSLYIAEYMNENERKALMLSMAKGMAMKGDASKVVVEEKDKDRPIFFEELFVEGKEPVGNEDAKASRKERDNISFESKLLRRVGIEKDDNVFEKLKWGQKGNDLDRKGMFAALRNRDTAAIKGFLDQSAEFCHIKDSKDSSPLHIACQLGHLESIQLLIDAGSDLSQKDKKGNTPFHLLFRAKFENVREVEQLLDGLSEAVEEGFVDFDATDEHGNTCLHCAVQGEGEGQLINWLIRKGQADPNAQNKTGESCLHNAIQSKSISSVTTLLAAGTDVWLKNTSNETAIDWAHDCGDPKIWDAILRRLNDNRWTRPPPPKKAGARATIRSGRTLGAMLTGKEKEKKADVASFKASPLPSAKAPPWSNSPTLSARKEGNRLSMRNPNTSSLESLAKSSRKEKEKEKEKEKGKEKEKAKEKEKEKKKNESKGGGKEPRSGLAAPPSPSSLDSLPPPKKQYEIRVLSYQDIKEQKEELDNSQLEAYLSDAEFVEVFKITREEFWKKPAWKRTMMKKDVDLF